MMGWVDLCVLGNIIEDKGIKALVPALEKNPSLKTLSTKQDKVI